MKKEMTQDEEQKVNETIERIKKEEYSETDAEKVIKNESRIKKLFTMEALKKFAEYVPMMFSMVKDYKAKRYTEVPVKSIVAIIATLLYVLLPVDVIPDFVPALGFTDDAAVFAWCLKMVSSDLEKYKEWKDQQADIKDVTPTENADPDEITI